MPFHPRADVFQKGATATMRWGAGRTEPGTVWPQMERVSFPIRRLSKFALRAPVRLLPHPILQIPSLVTVEPITPGAKVTLVDGVAALSLMSSTHRDQFDFLASAPVSI